MKLPPWVCVWVHLIYTSRPISLQVYITLPMCTGRYRYSIVHVQVHACQVSYSCIYTYMGKGMCQTADLYIAQDVINKKTVSIPI